MINQNIKIRWIYQSDYHPLISNLHNISKYISKIALSHLRTNHRINRVCKQWFISLCMFLQPTAKSSIRFCTARIRKQITNDKLYNNKRIAISNHTSTNVTVHTQFRKPTSRIWLKIHHIPLSWYILSIILNRSIN